MPIALKTAISLGMLKRFLKDSLVYGMVNIVARGMPLLVLPVYALFFSPKDFGVIDLLTIITTLVKLTVAFEITQAVARYFPQARLDRDKIAYASTALWFSMIMYSTFVVVLLPFSKHLSALLLGSVEKKPILIIAILTMWTEGMFNLFQNQLRYQLNAKRYAGITLLHALLSTGISFILILAFHMGVIGVFYGSFISGLVACTVASYWGGTNYHLTFDIEKCKQMLRFSLPLVPSSLAKFFFIYVDRICIATLLGLEALGVYGVSYRFALIAGLFLAGVQVALTPLIYHHYKEPRTPDEIGIVFRYFVAAVLPLLLALGLFSQDLLSFLAPGFHDAAPLIAWLGIGILLSNMYIFAPGLSIAGKTRVIMMINILAAVLNGALNLLLIPLLGLLGAVLATVISAFIACALHIHTSQAHYSIPYRWPLIAQAGSIGAVFWLLGNAMPLPVKGILWFLGTLLIICIILNSHDRALAVNAFRQLMNSRK